MIQIDDKILSLHIFTRKFSCDISKCKGMCCVDGDSGAPLEQDEVEIIKKIYPNIKVFLTKEGIKVIDNIGVSMIDSDGDTVTPLIDNNECAYANFDKNGVAFCAFEKAFFEKVISFRKPISCHLYPIRVKKFKDFEAINYDVWDICKPAIRCSKQNKVRVFRYLKDAIIRKFGTEFYNKLEIANKDIENENLAKISNSQSI